MTAVILAVADWQPAFWTTTVRSSRRFVVSVHGVSQLWPSERVARAPPGSVKILISSEVPRIIVTQPLVSEQLRISSADRFQIETIAIDTFARPT
jgi:hypothetical protein